MNKSGFAFGKNWQLFVKRYLNQERIEEAKSSLIKFCGGNKINGKTFIDIGCGSGLFSLAAYQLGASKIFSFDIDIDSVSCCEYLHRNEDSPTHWVIKQGSILDEEFVSQLGKFDFVYSWGVLHHSGDMWRAIENTLKLVDDQGLLYIAIYNKADSIGIYSDGRFGSSEFWVDVKRKYAHSPLFLQRTIDYMVMAFLIMLYIFTLKNPIKKIKSHKELRGMSWRVDISDWLGGYPYEFATVSEVFNFVKKFGFCLENLKCNNGLKNNEFLFKKL